ncbi:MAG TPA: hypothetical protein VF271_07095 [Rhodanobacteraceae bacterium]
MPRVESTRLSPRHWFFACLCALAFLLPAMAAAQAPGLSAADRADIQAFTINNDVFQRLSTVMTQARAMHVKRSPLDMSKVHSLADMAQQMVASDPRIKPLLAKYGFTPRQFLVANMAVVGTTITLDHFAGTPQEKAVEGQLNPANVAFYKAHKAQMDALLHSAATSAK